MCLYPKLIKNRKYTPNKKNGGNIPTMTDERTKYVPVGCGRCIECSKQRARNWQTRLLEDIKVNKFGHFITLTFSDQDVTNLYSELKHVPNGYDLDNETATLAVRRWLERIRKRTGKSARHWLVTELGHNGTENIHLHGIVWSDNIDKDLNDWKYGYTWKGTYLNEATVNYVTKYVTKTDIQHKYYKPIILCSKGIGSNYTKSAKSNWKLNKYADDQTNETYLTRKGTKIALPIYWRNKLYNDAEREKLWLNKLDKEERYILGSKIDVSNNYEEYNNALKHAREINRKLGYGNDEKNYEQEQYERNRRIIMQRTRIEKANKNNNNKA